jgi:hypothetical protein
MDNRKAKLKAQVSLEFVITFVMLVLFVVLVAKIFAYFGNRIVSRQQAYELTRSAAGNVAGSSSGSQINFFTGRPGNVSMDVFHEN